MSSPPLNNLTEKAGRDTVLDWGGGVWKFRDSERRGMEAIHIKLATGNYFKVFSPIFNPQYSASQIKLQVRCKGT